MILQRYLYVNRKITKKLYFLFTAQIYCVIVVVYRNSVFCEVIVLKVCDRLKLYISDRGLKQKSIAEKAGFTENQMSQILNGKRSISADELEIICNAMNAKPNDIYEIRE